MRRSCSLDKPEGKLKLTLQPLPPRSGLKITSLKVTAAVLGALVHCLACGGKVAPSNNDHRIPDQVLGSAEDVLNMLTQSTWGQPPIPRTGWFEFERIDGTGQVEGSFDFRDFLMPFEDCRIRRIGDCVVTECTWTAQEYSYRGSMDGGAELAKLERFTLSSNHGDKILFDVNDPTTSSSARVSEVSLETNELLPGGSWWGLFDGVIDDTSTSVWDLDVDGGSLDGLSQGGFVLPTSPTLAMPEGADVNSADDVVEIFVVEGEDYQLSWQRQSDAEFFQICSLGNYLSTVRCVFDGESEGGILPADATRLSRSFALGAANLQVRNFGENLPRGKQVLVVVSGAALVDEDSGKPVRLVIK